MQTNTTPRPSYFPTSDAVLGWAGLRIYLLAYSISETERKVPISLQSLKDHISNITQSLTYKANQQSAIYSCSRVSKYLADR